MLLAGWFLAGSLATALSIRALGFRAARRFVLCSLDRCVIVTFANRCVNIDLLVERDALKVWPISILILAVEPCNPLSLL